MFRSLRVKTKGANAEASRGLQFGEGAQPREERYSAASCFSGNKSRGRQWLGMDLSDRSRIEGHCMVAASDPAVQAAYWTKYVGRVEAGGGRGALSKRF
jgi:hypothetical protein